MLDFGCGYGMYTIPVAEIIGKEGIVYALDKDKNALDGLMRRANSAGLKNIIKMETSGELEIEIADNSIDVVLMFDVFHSFAEERPSGRLEVVRVDDGQLGIASGKVIDCAPYGGKVFVD